MVLSATRDRCPAAADVPTVASSNIELMTGGARFAVRSGGMPQAPLRRAWIEADASFTTPTDSGDDVGLIAFSLTAAD